MTVEFAEDVKTVFQAATSLPPEVREQLAEELWASLDEETSRETADGEAMQLEEIRRRLEAYRAGREKSYSAEEVRNFVRSEKQP